MATTITAGQFKTLLAEGKPLDLIDVRTPAEHRAVHLPGARLIPLHRLNPETVRQTRPADATGPCHLLCRSGSRSARAADKLRAAGIEATVIQGGLNACIPAGLPVEHGDHGVTIERQVRIAAGLLVLIGTILGATLSPWLLILPGFIGAGLAFAGITDTCGMAMVLTRMPWNQ